MKVAVVGSGVSGLAATWLLNEYTDYEVHLYEADSRPGGHANTVSFTRPGKDPIDVDTGFIVFNPTTYPNFLRFLSLYPWLRERIRETTMTFSISRDGGEFEWAGSSLGSVFCQPSRLLDPSMWRLLYDVMRFNACARRVLAEPILSDAEMSIGEYLRREKYSQSFMDNYLIPMTAVIWSTPPDKCALDFPARTLIQFMHNHHLLQVTGKPPWLTLQGAGGRTYVEHILSSLPPGQLHLSTPVYSVGARRLANTSASRYAVEISTASGEYAVYDHVILACHSDAALTMLRAGGCATPEQERILGAFAWNKNVAVLHYDERLMPKRRIAWSCWNYLTCSELSQDGKRKANVDTVSLTYWMNSLQHIPEQTYGPVFVTLNPPFDPEPARVVGRYEYEHPVLGTQAIRAQQEMSAIQGKQGISFAGAWLKYGFHEDGFTSGLRAAAALLESDTNGGYHAGKKAVRMPFEIVGADRTPGTETVLLARLFDFMEVSGLRVIVGVCLGWWLAALRGFLRFSGVDLRLSDSEPRSSMIARRKGD